MLEKLQIKNFTLFQEADLNFGADLNVIVGENGSGKTHLLKLVYSILAVFWEEGRKANTSEPTKTVMQTKIAEKLFNVFRPESLGRLARRRQGREKCQIQMSFERKNRSVSFNFATNSKSEVLIENLPKFWNKIAPAYIPTRELLSIFPNFVSIYESRYLEFEETWRDTCLLLGNPLQRGPKEKHINELLEPLEEAMDGKIVLDVNGRFYLKNASGRMEIPLVAEGLRKLGMLAYLIANGTLFDQGYLFWDEPEANLNPRLIKNVAKSIVDLSSNGIKITIATHSLFLLREIEILLAEHPKLDVQFFGLHKFGNCVNIKQGSSISDIGDIASLDEELEQSDRYLELNIKQ